MKNYLRAINKTNALIMDDEFSEDELSRIGVSDYRWAKSREKAFRERIVRKGDVYQFDFGKNIAPEMSYEHRGLVLGVNHRLLYVLPIFTFKPDAYSEIFEKDKNRKGNLYFLSGNSYDFLNHDSVLKLNDMRTVSVKRIEYQQKGGRIDVADPVFQEIEQLVFEKYFSDKAFLIEQQKTEIERLNSKIEELSSKIPTE